ncbi:MAG TPA: hypothetical protein VMS00_14990 [Acidimicrobiales bacterium]|nr:hypothetical protein [Acidimicrobiales bacterium]
MITRTSSNLRTQSTRRFSGRPSSRCSGLLLIATTALGLVAVPTVAQASSLPAQATPSCSKVSAASVAAAVGHSVPAGTYSTQTVKATKADDEISAVVTTCIYGSVKSLAALGIDVIVGFEVTSRPLTGGELKHALTQAQALKFVFKLYSGLGMKAFYYSFTDGGIPIQGIEAINGTTIYAAALYTKTPAERELGALVRLAEKL